MARLHSLFLAIVLFALCFTTIAAQSEAQTASLSIRPSATDSPDSDATELPQPTSKDDQDNAEPKTEMAAKPNLSDITPSIISKTSSTAAPKSTESLGFTTSTTSSTSSSAFASPTVDSTSDAVRTKDDWYKAPEEKLPLQPRMTVAFGFGGALLIITGTLLAFVGIQHKLLYICLSTVYLVCLSITVLIIYVMNPPVSDAVQGAYLVGIVVPGLIFGGGAMVFSNLTEGLGCMLGGFSLSMWLLCLKAGGLLTNTTSIVIFICVFSTVVLSTAYVNFFQPYTLIFSLAFSGATAIVLGIDCFSRAGLKEFWVYIWRLNDDIFPLGTTTYPMTRGIKAEVAGIVVFTVLGILVQWKLWGFIRKKHKAKMEERVAERRTLEREEEMIGRRVNWETSKQRERWEEVYHPDGTRIGPDGKAWQSSLGSDSGIGDMSAKRTDSHSTLGKKGVPQITVHEEAIEMAQLPNHSRSSSGAGSLSRRLSQIVYTTRGSNEDVQMVDSSTANARKSKDLDALAALEGGRSARTSKRDSKSKPVSGSPDTPFPSLGVGDGDNVRNSKRLSADSRGSRLLHRLSHNSSTDKRRSTSKKGLREDDDDCDASSSIAATIDDLQSDFDLADLRSLPSGTPRVSMVLDKAINASYPDPALVAEGLHDNESSSDWTWKKKAKEADILHMAGPSKSLTKDALPPAAPKVAATFRAEEWAKRLDDAEAPVVPEIEQPLTPTKVSLSRSSTEPPSPVSETIPEDSALHSAPSKDDETPAPVNIELLQQTALTGEVAAAPPRPRSAQPQSTINLRPQSRDQNPWRSSMQPNSVGHSADSSRPVTAQDVRERMAMKRSSSQGTLAVPKHQHRVSSNPLQPLQEKDDDTMSLRQRQSVLRQSSMPHVPSQRPASAQQYPPELQHLAMNHRQSVTRMQPPPPAMPNRMSTPGYGNPFAMGVVNRGVPMVQPTDLEIMEQRRLQMLEERRLAEVRKQQEQDRVVQRDVAYGDRYRMSIRQGAGDEVHREALRRMQSDAKVTP